MTACAVCGHPSGAHEPVHGACLGTWDGGECESMCRQLSTEVSD